MNQGGARGKFKRPNLPFDNKLSIIDESMNKNPIMRRIIVLNSKGGCGKTTIATNLASQFATRGYKTALFDYDPQASSTRWLESRPAELPSIYGVEAFPSSRMGMTRAWQLRMPSDTQRIVLDAPAGLLRPDLNEHLRGVDLILIPVQPSSIDTHAAAGFIRDLLLINKVRQHQDRVAIVANRTRDNTLAFANLERFLKSLRIPVVARLRDTQNYVHAAELGLGIHELTDYPRARQELPAWDSIIDWAEHSFANIRHQRLG